jgi:hypothetical protein
VAAALVLDTALARPAPGRRLMATAVVLAPTEGVAVLGNDS